MTAKDLYSENLELINQLLGFACRKHGLVGEEAKDVAQSVHLELWKNDCARIAAHRGDSSLKTFLAVVINQLILDEIRHIRGRWRPSAAARRAGSTAILLESLISRDGFSFDEAVAILTRNLSVGESPGELAALWDSLPPRVPRRMEPLGDDHPAEGDGGGVRDHDPQLVQSRLREVVDRFAKEVPLEDRMLLSLVFLEGFSIATAAKVLGTPGRVLYRRRDVTLAVFRSICEEVGLSWEEISTLVGWEEIQPLDLVSSDRADGSPPPREESHGPH
jgi:RNA polymerase sigma factor (sigma-70 family)